MVDWNIWTSTRKYFAEYDQMEVYIRENNIKDWSYTWTFAYGYELLIRR